MSRYLPARVRRFMEPDHRGVKAPAFRVVCAAHGQVDVRPTHNGAHMVKAAHNRLPHKQPVVSR